MNVKTLAQMIMDRIESANRGGFTSFRIDVRNADWMLIELKKEFGVGVSFGPVCRTEINGWAILTDLDNRNRLFAQKIDNGIMP